jgi:hypothetical protein
MTNNVLQCKCKPLDIQDNRVMLLCDTFDNYPANNFSTQCPQLDVMTLSVFCCKIAIMRSVRGVIIPIWGGKGSGVKQHCI